MAEGDPPKLVIDLLPQVGFLHPSKGKWEYFTKQELQNRNLLADEDLDKKTAIKILVRSEAEETRMLELLKAQGIDFKRIGEIHKSPVEDERLEVLIRSKFNSIYKRALAKIAFNYLAKTAGLDFVKHENFDNIRSFIRYGSPDLGEFVRATQQPILLDDERLSRQTNGHIVSVCWSRSRHSVLGMVSPFNEITYKVVLTPAFSGIWRDINSGHCFDIDQREVIKLKTGNRIIPVAGESAFQISLRFRIRR